MIVGITCAVMLNAQVIPPRLTIGAPSDTPGSTIPTRPLPATAAASYLRIKQLEMETPISFRDPHFPLDSMQQVVEAEGHAWSARLQQRPVTALQHDPAGGVGVIGTEVPYARAEIATRLAMPGMRVRDRAFTLLHAIQAFADTRYLDRHPERLPIAEQYLKQLDALGDSARYWQLAGRSTLIGTYYWLGRSSDVIRLGQETLERSRQLSFLEEEGPPLGVYYLMVEALSGQPDAPRKIAALTTLLRSIYQPPSADLIAVDSGFIEEDHKQRELMEEFIRRAAMLGHEGAPLLSNFWANRPTTDSAAIPVHDGKIRVIEIFSYGCDGCLIALFGLQRIQERFPTTVQTVATTFTLGYWANRLVSPDDEAERLNDYFTKQLKITFPVAIWKWHKALREDGGYRFDQSEDNIWKTPNGIHYPLFDKPTMYILDGQGRIRQMLIGGGRDVEQMIVQTVEFLQREAAQLSTQHTTQHAVSPTMQLQSTPPVS